MCCGANINGERWLSVRQTPRQLGPLLCAAKTFFFLAVLHTNLHSPTTTHSIGQPLHPPTNVKPHRARTTMAAQVGPLPQLKLASGPSPVTAEQRYWKTFKNQLLMPSPTSLPGDAHLVQQRRLRRDDGHARAAVLEPHAQAAQDHHALRRRGAQRRHPPRRARAGGGRRLGQDAGLRRRLARHPQDVDGAPAARVGDAVLAGRPHGPAQRRRRQDGAPVGLPSTSPSRPSWATATTCAAPTSCPAPCPA